MPTVDPLATFDKGVASTTNQSSTVCAEDAKPGGSKCVDLRSPSDMSLSVIAETITSTEEITQPANQIPAGSTSNQFEMLFINEAFVLDHMPALLGWYNTTLYMLYLFSSVAI